MPKCSEAPERDEGFGCLCFSLLRFLANLPKFKYQLKVKPEFDK